MVWDWFPLISSYIKTVLSVGFGRFFEGGGIPGGPTAKTWWAHGLFTYLNPPRV